MVKIRNIKGTGENYPNPSCNCSSWLDHWETNKNLTAGYCRCCKVKIDHNSLVGGHVKKVDSIDNSYYIVPLCNSCNNYNNTDAFYVNEEDLVSVSRCIQK